MSVNLPPAGPSAPRSRFDANAAWKSAVGVIRTNRAVLLVMAGLFFVLPQLAVDFILPEPPAGLEGEAAGEAMVAIYARWWPLMLLGLVAQGAGLLAVIVLIAGRGRPDVRESIGAGLKALPTLIAAQLVVGAGVGLAMLLVLLPFAAIGGESVMGLSVIPVLALAMWVYSRTMLIAPVVAAGGMRNPFEAILASWSMTKGNASRLLVFFLLLLLAMIVIYLVATSVPGAIVAAIGGPEAGGIAVALFGSVVIAGFSLVSTVALTAAWRQLAPAASVKG